MLPRKLITGLGIVVMLVPSAFAQKSKTADKDRDPRDQPRHATTEPKKVYQDWIDKDVAYIITEAERGAFKKLQTNDERERFIEEFWRRRNPDPDSEENSYREQYYERIAYANEHFASGIPGWKTDRGMIYIKYKLDVKVRDVTSGATGVKHVGFVVPKYDSTKLSTSTLVLAVKLEGLGDQPAVGMFTIGNVEVIPNLSGTYQRGAPVGVYMQIYNAGIDQTTLRPSVDVDYVLLKDGKELGKQPEDWRGNGDAGQRLTVARLVDTRGLAPGEYTIEVRVRDHVSGQSLVQSAKFAVL